MNKSLVGVLIVIMILSFCGIASAGEGYRTVIKTELLPWIVLHPNVIFERVISNNFTFSLGGNTSGNSFGIGAAAYYYLRGMAPRGFHVGPSAGYHSGGSFMVGADLAHQWITSKNWVIRAGLSAVSSGGNFAVAPLFGVGRAF